MNDTGPILLPLDGSELSEGALPYVTALARAVGAPLRLLTVWEGADSELAATIPDMAVEIDRKGTEHYTRYLEGVRGRLGSVEAETVVRPGDAPDVILDEAERSGARALAIATHGRSGIGRWFYGSTAAHLLRRAPVPLLAVGPQALEHPADTVNFRHLMVPLDGSELSETALPLAKSLAQKLGARISIVRVVRWAVQAYPYSLPDAYIPQIDTELEAGSKAYVTRHKDATAGDGVGVDAFVVRGAVADGLIEFIDKEAVDLVVMTTHGRGGIARATLGSVSDRMLQGAAPVLLIR